MRLSPDCVRDILLVVENETTATHRTAYPSKEFDTLDEKYNPDVVLYHVIQCMEYGYFRDAEHLGHMGILIPDLSRILGKYPQGQRLERGQRGGRKSRNHFAERTHSNRR